MDISDRIFTLLSDLGIEQKQFAKFLGVVPQTITDWKNGKSKSFTKYIPQIAEILNTTTEYLLIGEGPKTKPPVSEAGKNSNAATREGSGITDEFARIFAQLTPENQNRIIAEMLKRQRNQ
ncbi:putative Xre family DNA-binding protein [Oscillibacter valericigenes Sjm18-20]|nr:putative Xre family DNA-binding protein [Oscillibacter valericigenes Sjm18-20]